MKADSMKADSTRTDNMKADSMTIDNTELNSGEATKEQTGQTPDTAGLHEENTCHRADCEHHYAGDVSGSTVSHR